jgi:hypothetical protein
VATPTHIGRYRLERVLGQGGFGLVYLAHDERLQRPVALKVPHPERVECPQDAEAYLTEARTVANLDHPHIVPVYDVGTTPDCPCFVVSRFIDGTDLALTLVELGDLTPAGAQRTVAVLVEAMAKVTDPPSLLALVQGLGALAPRLEPGEAKEAAALTRALAKATDPPLSLAVAMAVGLRAVAARMEPGEAATKLTQAIARARDPDVLQALAEGLGAVAARMERKEAAAACAMAAAALTRAMAEASPSGLLALA